MARVSNGGSQLNPYPQVQPIEACTAPSTFFSDKPVTAFAQLTATEMDAPATVTAVQSLQQTIRTEMTTIDRILFRMKCSYCTGTGNGPACGLSVRQNKNANLHGLAFCLKNSWWCSPLLERTFLPHRRGHRRHDYIRIRKPGWCSRFPAHSPPS